jgi:predicted nuclease of predicted toxin-antitoxin system
MSGNNCLLVLTDKLNNEINMLLKELDNILISKDPDVFNWTATLENKYKYLSSSSPTLFKYILKNYGQDKFDKAFFEKTIKLMLLNIENIQNSKITQHDASENVGTHLAHQFIPQLRQDQK